MMKIITSAQMQVLDHRVITEARIPGTTLMERAGAGVAACLEEEFGPVRGKTVCIICGKGNNGGDGLVVARLLRQRQAKVKVLAMAPVSDLSRDAATMYRRYTRVAGRTSIRPIVSKDLVRALLRDSDVIIDALFGTGLSSEIIGLYADVIDVINEAGRPVVAVDLPSGLHADTGRVLGHAVQADLTVTFGLPKLGCYLRDGIDLTGTLRIVDIGIPPSYIDEVDARTTLMTESFVRTSLPSRTASSHKGTFGHAGLIAGSVGKTGAAAMAAQAALRVGTGLVTVAIPSGLNEVLESKLLEAMTVPMPGTKARTFARSAYDRLTAFITARTAVGLGPGLTTHPETVELVQALVKTMHRPAVLDADALNALAGRASLLTECKTPPIITPHPGEMARLEPDATPQSVNADRIGTASRFARERGVFVVLKGARTVVARPDGAVALCPTGNSGMATGGTGDVLTGMMVGLLAQGLPSWEAACVATYLHGFAGDLAATALGQAGLIAGDVIDQIPFALKVFYGK